MLCVGTILKNIDPTIMMGVNIVKDPLIAVSSCVIVH